MSRTKHVVIGKEFPAKTKRKPSVRKFFGYTSGIHSEFENVKELYKSEFEISTPADLMHPIKKRNWEKIKNKTYPEKNKDFVKYGYGNGSKKRVKNYKKEIE